VEIREKVRFSIWLLTSHWLDQIPSGKLGVRACGDHNAVGLKPLYVLYACGDLNKGSAEQLISTFQRLVGRISVGIAHFV
jgi:hypothetical protein